MTTLRQLNKKIKQREQEMHEKKIKLHEDSNLLLQKMGAPSSIGVGLLTGVFVGFVLPRSLSSILKRRKEHIPSKEIIPAEQPAVPKKKTSRLHSLLFILTDILAIISSFATFREAFAKISHRFRKV